MCACVRACAMFVHACVCHRTTAIGRYLSMRKQSHFWYKVLRADKPRALCYDFLSSYKRPPSSSSGSSNSSNSGSDGAVADAAQADLVAGTTDQVALEADVMDEGMMDVPFV